MHSTLVIFLDGVGIGKADPSCNPFFNYGFSTFTQLFGEIPNLRNTKLSKDGRYIFPTDAIMGVDGLPQSGTGQTSIFCGVNAQRILGSHFGPFPHSILLPIIREQNIFKMFKSKKKKVSFVNAYPKVFFEYIESGKKRLSVTSLSCQMSDVYLNKSTELRKGNALSAEIDNKYWKEKLGYKIKIIKPETAAKRLLKIASQNHFTLFEHFHTDHLGHGRNFETLEERLNVLDNFLFYILNNLPDNLSLLICSDHGNLEDVSVKTHTLNPALTISAGKYADRLSQRITNLSHIKDAILELY